jgi:hypothetical protein
MRMSMPLCYYYLVSAEAVGVQLYGVKAPPSAAAPAALIDPTPPVPAPPQQGQPYPPQGAYGSQGA